MTLQEQDERQNASSLLKDRNDKQQLVLTSNQEGPVRGSVIQHARGSVTHARRVEVPGRGSVSQKARGSVVNGPPAQSTNHDGRTSVVDARTSVVDGRTSVLKKPNNSRKPDTQQSDEGSSCCNILPNNTAIALSSIAAGLLWGTCASCMPLIFKFYNEQMSRLYFLFTLMSVISSMSAGPMVSFLGVPTCLVCGPQWPFLCIYISLLTGWVPLGFIGATAGAPIAFVQSCALNVVILQQSEDDEVASNCGFKQACVCASTISLSVLWGALFAAGFKIELILMLAVCIYVVATLLMVRVAFIVRDEFAEQESEADETENELADDDEDAPSMCQECLDDIYLFFGLLWTRTTFHYAIYVMFFSFSHVVFLTQLPLVIKPEMVCIVLPIYNLMTVTCGGFVGAFWDSSDHKKYICYGYPTLIGVYGVIFFAGQQLDEGPLQMGIFIVFAMIGGLTFLGLFVTAVPIIAVFWEQDMDIAVGFVDFFRMMGQLAALAVVMSMKSPPTIWPFKLVIVATLGITNMYFWDWPSKEAIRKSMQAGRQSMAYSVIQARQSMAEMIKRGNSIVGRASRTSTYIKNNPTNPTKGRNRMMSSFFLSGNAQLQAMRFTQNVQAQACDLGRKTLLNQLRHSLNNYIVEEGSDDESSMASDESKASSFNMISFNDSTIDKFIEVEKEAEYLRKSQQLPRSSQMSKASGQAPSSD